MCGELADVPTDGDTIRAAFDAWIAEVDPNGSLNDYERGRLYLGPAGSSVRTHIAEIRRKNGEGSGAGAE